MATPPTPRQLEMLRFINGYMEVHGRAPSLHEMAAGLGLAGRPGAHRLLSGLELRGHVTVCGGQARSIQLLTEVSIPRAPNGAPLFAVPGFGPGNGGE